MTQRTKAVGMFEAKNASLRTDRRGRAGKRNYYHQARCPGRYRGVRQALVLTAQACDETRSLQQAAHRAECETRMRVAASCPGCVQETSTPLYQGTMSLLKTIWQCTNGGLFDCSRRERTFHGI